MFYIVLPIGMVLVALATRGLSAFELIVIALISAPIAYWMARGWQLHLLRQKQIRED